LGWKAVRFTYRALVTTLNSLIAPPSFKRRAVAHLSAPGLKGKDTLDSSLVFPYRQNTRLVVSYITTDPFTGEKSVVESVISDEEIEDLSPLVNEQIKCMQREVVEQELFHRLLEDCSHLPTVSARVSERVVEVEVIQGIKLKFELVW
jgi:hypothetical protein